jgi:ParB family chromosome partitioning protein
MSRKRLFDNLVDDDPPPLSAPQQRSPAVAAVGRIGQMLQAMEHSSSRAAEIEKQLLAAEHIVEIDPSLIDPSPVRDRIEAPDPEADQDLVDSLREYGQRVPVLLRPHPKGAGRHLTVYGHRRIRALRVLGRPVKAIVGQLSDAEALVVQGQENNVRKNPSFIERSLYAKRLRDAGLQHMAIAAALGVTKSLAIMTVGVAESLPEDLILAIGPAPDVGRPRWQALASLVQNKPAGWALVVSTPEFHAAKSNDRFAMVINAFADVPALRRSEQSLSDDGGEVYALVSRSRKESVVKLPFAESQRSDGVSFAEWIEARLPQFREDYLSGR